MTEMTQDQLNIAMGSLRRRFRVELEHRDALIAALRQEFDALRSDVRQLKETRNGR